MATNKEMISALKYNDSFKNALRNYYSYGFLCLRAFDKSQRKTTSDDWERLTTILDQYIEWSYASGDSKAVMFVTTDSQTLLCNPFHKLFRHCMCNAKDVAYFFHMIAALADNMYLNVRGKVILQPFGVFVLCTKQLFILLSEKYITLSFHQHLSFQPFDKSIYISIPLPV